MQISKLVQGFAWKHVERRGVLNAGTLHTHSLPRADTANPLCTAARPSLSSAVDASKMCFRAPRYEFNVTHSLYFEVYSLFFVLISYLLISLSAQAYRLSPAASPDARLPPPYPMFYPASGVT